LQHKLAERFVIGRPEAVAVQSSEDATRKFLFRFRDGQEAETVYIPGLAEDRGAVCISSQVGCTLACRFCHTGTQRLTRNLGAAEIVGQFMAARDAYGEWPSPTGEAPRLLSTIVLMGMGEPLYNYSNVAKAMTIAMDNEGIALSRRRITLSTSGVVPMMDRAGAELGVNLAVSLHAARDELRDELVPLNRKYPIAELIAACRRYPGASNARRITFEYVMLKGVNDSQADARELVRLIAGIPAKVNLIPFNPWPCSPFETSSNSAIDRFARIVMDAGFASPVRSPRWGSTAISRRHRCRDKPQQTAAEPAGKVGRIAAAVAGDTLRLVDQQRGGDPRRQLRAQHINPVRLPAHINVALELGHRDTRGGRANAVQDAEQVSFLRRLIAEAGGRNGNHCVREPWCVEHLQAVPGASRLARDHHHAPAPRAQRRQPAVQPLRRSVDSVSKGLALEANDIEAGVVEGAHPVGRLLAAPVIAITLAVPPDQHTARRLWAPPKESRIRREGIVAHCNQWPRHRGKLLRWSALPHDLQILGVDRAISAALVGTRLERPGPRFLDRVAAAVPAKLTVLGDRHGARHIHQ
jgi:23S rRNA (adenine2503-C2)-methyltransferase